ncbi:MAG: choice-of-anchor B family protein [Ignavibacteria bacterium]
MKKIIFLLLITNYSLIISYAQTSSNMYQLASLDQHGNGYSACWGYTAPNGREYAILGCNTGTAFIDITDSANIHEVSFKTGLTSGWREMKVYSHYAYVVSEATGSGVQIFDLQYLPDSVHFVTTYTFTGYNRTHSISQSGPYLYLNGGNYGMGGVVVLDLTQNPEAPVKRGEWETRYVHDCRVRQDTIWACNISSGQVTVINATNKDNLQTVTQWTNLPSPNAPHNCEITQDRRYILVTDEVFGGTPGKLKVWNIENLSNITYVTSWGVPNTTSTVHNVEIYGDTAVLAYYGRGVRVLDISNPAVPVEIAYYITPSCWGVYMFGSRKIIDSDVPNGLYVLKVGTLVGIQPISNEIPSQSRLYQNYPNPFNPITNLEFQITNLGFVRLIVYDVLGREVAVLVNEELKAGTYEAEWDASGFPSGVYFYKLATGDFSQTKKMVLVK